MHIEGLSSMSLNYYTPIKRNVLSQEKKEDTGLASILGELKRDNIKLETDKRADKKWYRLGTFSGEDVQIVFFPDGSFKTSNTSSQEVIEEAHKAASFSSVLEILKERNIKLEAGQWYKLGTYGGQPVHIRFFSRGGRETSNNPIVLEEREAGSPVSQETIESGRIVDSFSAEDHNAIIRDSSVLTTIFSILNRNFRVTMFSKAMEDVGYTISDVKKLLSRIEVSDGPTTYRPVPIDQIDVPIEEEQEEEQADRPLSQTRASYGLSSYQFKPLDLIKEYLKMRLGDPEEKKEEELRRQIEREKELRGKVDFKA